MEKDTHAESVGELMETALKFRESAALLAAIKLDLFEHFGTEPQLPKNALDTLDSDGLNRLCRALAGMDLLEKDGNQFSNSEETESLLTSRGKVDLRPFLKHLTDLYNMWGELDEAIEIGQHYEFEPRNDDTFDEEFTEAMEARAHFSSEELTNAISDLLNGGRLLDLGGGSGIFARSLLDEDPNLTGVVADKSAPLAVARELIEENNLGDRLETRELDLLADEDYGDGFDIVLISAILHIFDPDDAQIILNRSFEALSPGGIVVVRDYMIDNDQTGPLDGLLFDVLMYLATENGQTYTGEELRRMSKQAGFENLIRRNLPRTTNDLLIGKRIEHKSP